MRLVIGRKTLQYKTPNRKKRKRKKEDAKRRFGLQKRRDSLSHALSKWGREVEMRNWVGPADVQKEISVFGIIFVFVSDFYISEKII